MPPLRVCDDPCSDSRASLGIVDVALDARGLAPVLSPDRAQLPDALCAGGAGAGVVGPVMLGDESCGEVVAVDALQLGGLRELDAERNGNARDGVEMDSKKEG